jgi:hypothetical protein
MKLHSRNVACAARTTTPAGSPSGWSTRAQFRSPQRRRSCGRCAVSSSRSNCGNMLELSNAQISGGRTSLTHQCRSCLVPKLTADFDTAVMQSPDGTRGEVVPWRCDR